MSNTEQTLSIIKPDAVERNLDNEIKEMFKNKDFSIVKEIFFGFWALKYKVCSLSISLKTGKLLHTIGNEDAIVSNIIIPNASHIEPNTCKS